MLPPSGFIRALRLNREGVPDFGVYPFAIPAIREMERWELHRAVTFFVCGNGIGKPTLPEALAARCRFNAEGSGKNYRFDTQASDSSLFRHLTLKRRARHQSDGYFLRTERLLLLRRLFFRVDQSKTTSPK